MSRERRVAASVLAVVLLLQACVVAARLHREPHIDEIEMLHSGWLMANGGAIYETFFQHHSPLLPATLAVLAPRAERVDAQPYAERARVLSGLAGLLALAAFAMLVFRTSPMAAPIAVLVVFGTGSLWLRIIADVRAETFAMAFFWIGAALVALPKKQIALLAGVGTAFVAIANMWTPKWPLCALVIGVYALTRARKQWWVAVISGVVLVTIAIIAMNAIAPLDLIRYFVVDFNSARDLWPARAATERAFHEAPALLSLPIVIVAAIVSARVRGAWLFVALFAASVLEVRFVHPYPAVGSHSYALWAFAGAALVAFVPMSVIALLQRAPVGEALRARLTFVIYAFALLLFLPNIALQLFFANRDLAMYWRSQKYLVSRLHVGDTVWLSTVRRNPITVHDASYYWFGIEDARLMLLIANHLRTPRGAHYLKPLTNLPLCSALRSEGTLRFVGLPYPGVGLQAELACFDELRAQRRVRSTPFPRVYEILPKVQR